MTSSRYTDLMTWRQRLGAFLWRHRHKPVAAYLLKLVNQ